MAFEEVIYVCSYLINHNVYKSVNYHLHVTNEVCWREWESDREVLRESQLPSNLLKWEKTQQSMEKKNYKSVHSEGRHC